MIFRFWFHLYLQIPRYGLCVKIEINLYLHKYGLRVKWKSSNSIQFLSYKIIEIPNVLYLMSIV